MSIGVYVCGGCGSKGEGALEILSCRWEVDVNEVGSEVGADGCGRVHIRSDLACIQWRVVVVADDGG